MSPMSWTVFYARLIPDVTALIRFLFARHRGDYAAAKEEVRLIKDYWASMADDRARIDTELARLKAEGK